jgi:hypothetical protein
MQKQNAISPALRLSLQFQNGTVVGNRPDATTQAISAMSGLRVRVRVRILTPG